MIDNRFKDGHSTQEEINRICNPFITKSFNTIELLLKEILQDENYMLEYDRIYMDK